MKDRKKRMECASYALVCIGLLCLMVTKDEFVNWVNVFGVALMAGGTWLFNRQDKIKE